MTESEFRSIIGKDLVVDYPFGDELQQYSMKNFYINENNEIEHDWLKSLIIEIFIANARNPHVGEPTHG